MVVSGPMSGELFLAYVKHCLVPTLKPNDIVVMDLRGRQPVGEGRVGSRRLSRWRAPGAFRPREGLNLLIWVTAWAVHWTKAWP
jgi:hypothetical protein